MEFVDHVQASGCLVLGMYLTFDTHRGVWIP